ncbi:MAG TPA: DNA polymerase III subunit delta [Gemmataceae bacterium]|nr:DNA polymerase III subunit delta [Gemmataceae bacterium]
MDSLAFLDRKSEKAPRSVYILHGDERLLKRRALIALRALVLGPDDEGFGVTSHGGDKADWSTVSTELAAVGIFSPRRLVIIEDADPFVTRERALLEKYVAAPSAVGVLVLDVQTWPSNTKLAKLVPDEATIVCKAPAAARLPEWCVRWCAAEHGKQLVAAAARLLVDLVGGEMGRLDQETAKLAAYVGDAKRIDAADVDALVGASRAENTWRIFDLIADGQAGEALTLLDRLFNQGEDPFRLLGAFSMQLRRLAQAGRLFVQGTPIVAALEEVGVPPFGRTVAEKQMRRLGRRRLGQLYDWLLQIDLGLKGMSPLPPRALFERLVVELARSPGAARPVPSS